MSWLKGKTCLLDMDGVIADLVAGMERTHGKMFPPDGHEGQIDFYIEKAWGMTPEVMWHPANSADWWQRLPVHDGAHELVTLLEEAFENRVVILSSPTNGACMTGKYAWLEQHFPQFTKGRYFFGRAKNVLAGPNNVLVDDWDKNIDKFRAAGGHAIMYPRQWNPNWQLAGCPNDYVRGQLHVQEERDGQSQEGPVGDDVPESEAGGC